MTPSLPHPLTPTAWRRWLVPGLLLAAGAAALAIDGPVARWMAAGGIRGEVANALRLSEFFGHGFGALMVILAVHQLDPWNRPTVPRLLAASLGAGLAADVIKLVVARLRPRDFDLAQGALESFIGWFPLGTGGGAVQSFPSAHTATAVGLAVALVWLYPRGRRLFALLALLVAGQRLQSGAHFPSDTLIGAGVGWMTALAVLPGGAWAGWFDRWETRRRAKKGLDGPGPRDETAGQTGPRDGLLIAAQQCGTWLFRRRTYTLTPLAALIVAAAVLVPAAPGGFSFPGLPLAWAGAGALVAAAAIRLHVAGRARRGTSARGITFEAGTLITTGMYALVRNPLYVANVLVWCGMAMLTGSLAVAAAVTAVAGIHFQFIVLAEERYLARRYGNRYGNRYGEYCRRVGRWLPRLGSGRRAAADASAAPFTWSRALFREADTLFLLVLGGWLIGGLGHIPTPWHHPAQVAGAWYLVPVAPALAWLAIKWLKKSGWRRRYAAVAEKG